MATGLVRWEWHSLDHVATSESETETPTSPAPWDWFHLNSIDPEPDGERPHLGAQHMGRLSAAARHRRDPVAPGRPEELLQDGAWHRNGVAARRPRPPRRGAHLLRRRLRTRRYTTSRARLRIVTRPRDPRSATAARLHTPRARRCWRPARATCRRCRTERRARLRRRARDHRVRAGRVAPVRCAPAFDMSFYRAFRFPWTGRPPSPPAVIGEPEQHRRRDDRAHELERRERGVRLARARRRRRPGSLSAQRHGPGQRLRDLDDAAAGATPRAVQALSAAGSVLATSGRSRWSATRPRCPGPRG